MKSGKRQIDFVIIVILITITFNFSFNLDTFPAYFWDQGVYIDRAIVLLEESKMYQDQYYIDHPPLGWVFQSAVFWIFDFPNSIVNESSSATGDDFELRLLLLNIIPRLLMMVFTVLNAILVYKISLLFYQNKSFAKVSLVIFALIPAMWPFRNFLLDPIMIFFVLFSLFILLGWNSKKLHESKISYSRLILSGFVFGVAFLTKLTAIFFLPVLILFVLGYGLKSVSKSVRIETKSEESFFQVKNFSIRQRTKQLTIWVIPIILMISAWLIHLEQSGSLEYLISTQFWQSGRASEYPLQGLALLFIAAPLSALFGIIGLAKILKNKQILSLLTLPYFAFLLRGGYVSFVHTIPLLPILCIFAGKTCHQFASKLLRMLFTESKYDEITFHKIKLFTLVILLILSGIVTVWITSFDETSTSRDTIQYLINTIPENSILVTDSGYSWIIKTIRPDLEILDVYSLNNLDSTPNEFYYAEKIDAVNYDQNLEQTESLYEKSCLVTEFQKEYEQISFFHPFSLISEDWWNIEVRYYNVKGCE